MNEQEHFYWIYGRHTVELLFKHAVNLVQCVYIQQKVSNVHNKNIEFLLKNCLGRKIKVIKQSKQWLDHKSQGGNHQGILVRCQLLKGLVERELPTFIAALPHNPLVLVLDKVQDPHNLGACFRNAEALGVDLIIFAKSGTVGLTSIVHKIASGATFTVPFLQAGNVMRVIKNLQQQGIWFVAITLTSGASTLNSLDLSVPTGLVIGSEGEGIGHGIEAQCDYRAYIPMLGSINSLNLSAACAISLYECQRQRSG